MPIPSREIVLAGDASVSGDEIGEACGGRFAITAPSQVRRIRRTWLDTFDWRLFRAGLTLEFRSGRGPGGFLLTGRDGEPITSQPAAPTTGATAAGCGRRVGFPCLVGDLPDGPLPEHLAPVAGVRALLPVVRAVSVQTDRRALNADDKTVAVVTVDQMTLREPRQGTAPVRIVVTPLRGYQSESWRLAEALAGLPGAGPAERSAFESALAVAGRKPADYSSKVRVELTDDMPAARALALILTSLFGTVQDNLAGTAGDVDIEFLHDLRIGVRRTRSVLKIAGSMLPADITQAYRGEFKWLGDLTTPTRDLDVYLLEYPAMTKGLVAAADRDLQPFSLFLQRQRAAAQRRLAQGLRSARFARLASTWPADLARIADTRRRHPEAGEFAAQRIAGLHRRVLRTGGAIGPSSPPQALHDLRKRCKELRYALEVFASLYDPAVHWRAVRELKSLQDCLGEFQDTEVQLGELRAFAAQMMADRSVPAATLLAMGEVAAAIAVRQRAARAEFAGRFADFSSHRGRSRITALTEAAS